jgi:eukaryotic-like serine/threonine-protein kinase
VKVANYTIQKELSRGPITTVFLATQTALERSVLLKILNVQWKGEKDLVERFHREAKICARLKHPNLVNIFDFGTSESSFYLAMEYVEGWSLADFIKQNHPLPISVILLIFKELLNGMEYAHAQGVIHRDIKPSNIMVGKDATVKISDFGLATIADFPALTEMGGTVGTPSYMSPEQAQGKKLDAKSDLFSLGTTVYEMACSENPFSGENFADSIRMIMNKRVTPLVRKRSDAPDWLSDLVQRLLEKNPQKRVSSAGDVIREVSSLADIPDSSVLKSFINSPASRSGDVDKETYRKASNKNRVLYAFFSILGIIAVIALLINQTSSSNNSTSSNVTLNKPEKGIVPDSMQILSEQTPEIKNQQVELVNPKPVGQKEKIIENSGRVTAQKTNEDAETDSKTAEEIPEIEPGGIFISTYPWAKIYIDGEYQEMTPLKKPLQLKAGMYALRLENPNYKPVEQRITIKPATIDSANFNLQPLFGFLELQVIPWAEVYINDIYQETTPLAKPLSLPAGKHQLKLINPNFRVWTDSIEIKAGQTYAAQVSLLK